MSEDKSKPFSNHTPEQQVLIASNMLKDQLVQNKVTQHELSVLTQKYKRLEGVTEEYVRFNSLLLAVMFVVFLLGIWLGVSL